MIKKQAILHVDGMTCASCEKRIAHALKALDGVSDARASLRGGKVEIEYDEGKAGPDQIRAAIEKAGYSVRAKPGATTAIALGIGIMLAAVYLTASASGVFNALPSVNASLGYGMLFVVGLLTSVHCVAMCGGIALSQSVSKISAEKRTLEKIIPGLQYNGGRILSYTIIGGLVGALGGAFNFSPLFKGIIAGAAGLFMVMLGLKMLGVLPALPNISRFMPSPVRALSGRVSSSLAKQGPFAVGVLNGIMPCGPLQTMQLYALGTGSMLSGALSMLIFSVGTVPLMLIFSVGAAFLPRKFIPVMLKTSAVLVMFLGVVTLSRGAAFAGITTPLIPSYASSAGPNAAPAGGVLRGTNVSGKSEKAGVTAKVENGVQTVVTVFGSNNFVPFTVQAGVPLKWTIRISADDLNGCNNAIVVPAYNIEKKLHAGDTLVEFTPTKTGTIAYSCWMGMIRSRINVVDDVGAVGDVSPQLLIPVPAAAQGSPSASGNGVLGTASGSCCSGSTNAAFAGGKVPVDTIGIPVIKNGVQEITIAVNGQGYSPAAIVLQKGMKAVIRFKADELTSCNSRVIFPELNGQLNLSKGELATPAIPIGGDFTFQCSMGMLHGYVKTVDDINKIDLKKIKAEIGNYRASGGSGANGAIGGGCCGQ